VVQWCRLVYAE